MKKITVYTSIYKNGELIVEKYNGWTDGNFHYYKNAKLNTWYVIDPKCGMALCDGDTRKEAQEKVYSFRIKRDYDVYTHTPWYKEMCNEWRNRLIVNGFTAKGDY